MSDEALETYLETIDRSWEPIVRKVDAAVRASGAPFDVAVKYRILMYTLEKDWRHWICAVSVTKKAVNLRFLQGVRMSDPAKLLRPGTSTLMTMDMASEADVDAGLITGYVREAVSLQGRGGE